LNALLHWYADWVRDTLYAVDIGDGTSGGTAQSPTGDTVVESSAVPQVQRNRAPSERCSILDWLVHLVERSVRDLAESGVRLSVAELFFDVTVFGRDVISAGIEEFPSICNFYHRPITITSTNIGEAGVRNLCLSRGERQVDGILLQGLFLSLPHCSAFYMTIHEILKSV